MEVRRLTRPYRILTALLWVGESVGYGSLGFKRMLSYTVDRYHAFQPYMLCYAMPTLNSYKSYNTPSSSFPPLLLLHRTLLRLSLSRPLLRHPVRQVLCSLPGHLPVLRSLSALLLSDLARASEDTGDEVRATESGYIKSANMSLHHEGREKEGGGGTHESSFAGMGYVTQVGLTSVSTIPIVGTPASPHSCRQI